MKKVLKKAFGLDTWNVGRVNDLELVMRTGDIGVPYWIFSAGFLSFKADPVGLLEESGSNFLLYEELNRITNRGCIKCVCVDDLGINEKKEPVVRTVIEDPSHHFSFPFLFRFNGIDWLVPESSDANELQYYERVGAEWRKVAALTISGSFIDPVFYSGNDGIWYLFHTSIETGTNTTLHLKTSTTPFGPWAKHPDSPLEYGLRGGRPAGPVFSYRGSLYRPSQNCEISYGGSLIIFKVKVLTKNRYVEEEFIEIAPPKGKYQTGIHSFFVHNNHIYIDGNWVRYSAMAPFIKIGNICRTLSRS